MWDHVRGRSSSHCCLCLLPIPNLSSRLPQIPAMAKCGKKGSIIVNTSVGGSRVCRLPEMRGMGVHAATKAGADMLMKYAAIEVSPLGD